MNIYDVEFGLLCGMEGRAIVKAETSDEALELLIYGLMGQGISIDGNDSFDVLEVDVLKEDGSQVAIIGLNQVKNTDIP
jgi:hypothetical protein